MLILTFLAVPQGKEPKSPLLLILWPAQTPLCNIFLLFIVTCGKKLSVTGRTELTLPTFSSRMPGFAASVTVHIGFGLLFCQGISTCMILSIFPLSSLLSYSRVSS